MVATEEQIEALVLAVSLPDWAERLDSLLARVAELQRSPRCK